MNPEEEADRQVKEIKCILKESEEMGAGNNEIILQIIDLLPEKIVEIERVVEIEKKPISSKEKLEYLKFWRENQKELNKIEEIKQREAIKIKKAKERKSFFCYNCQKSVSINDTSSNEAEVIKKPSRTKKSIIISNKCPICSKIIKSFGGWL